jgi:hypothetical protein
MPLAPSARARGSVLSGANVLTSAFDTYTDLLRLLDVPYAKLHVPKLVSQPGVEIQLLRSCYLF